MNGLLGFDLVLIPIFDPGRRQWLFLAYCTRTQKILIINSGRGIAVEYTDKEMVEFTRPAHDLYYSAPFSSFLNYLKKKYTYERELVRYV